MLNQYNFLNEDNRLGRLSQLGDPLEKLKSAIDFEVFRPLLNAIFGKEKDIKKGGRPPWDFMLIFKIMILQELYNIADEKMEYMINDRLSFQRFLDLNLASKVPDAKTIWLYKDILSKSGREKEPFDLFVSELDKSGIITRMGSLVDATFVDAPRQRNSRAENETIKNGEIPEDWQKDDNKTKNKVAQKDTDARWTKKNNETHFGYKNHAKVDQESKIITDFSVTDASVHDSKELVDLVDEKDEVLYADSAYVGEELHEKVKEKNPEIELKIVEKGYRNKPLTDEQKANNKEISKIRVRVEHPFGHMTNSMGGIFVRGIGIKKAKLSVALKNLAYNMSRFAFLERQKLKSVTT